MRSPECGSGHARCRRREDARARWFRDTHSPRSRGRWRGRLARPVRSPVGPRRRGQEIRLDRRRVAQGCRAPVEPLNRAAQMKNHTSAFVQLADEAANFRAHDAFERFVIGSDDVHADLTSTERRGDFKADEARPDHNDGLRRLGLRDNRPAVRECSQVVNLRAGGAGDIQSDRIGACGDQECVERVGRAAFELDTLLVDIEREAGIQDEARSGVRCRTRAAAVVSNPPVPSRRENPLKVGSIARGASSALSIANAVVAFPAEHVGGGESGASTRR